MTKLLLASCVCIAMAVSLEAGGRGIDLRPMKQDYFRSEPRKIVTALFSVKNNTDQTRTFNSSVTLPEQWSLLITEPPFTIDARKTDLRLVSFLIPKTTLAGTYDVRYTVRDREYPSVSDSYSIKVEVLPLIRLKAKLIEVPDRAIAGEQYSVTFLILNESNTSVTVAVDIESTEAFPFSLDVDRLKLSPGESRQIKVSVATPSKISKAVRHLITLSAVVQGNESISVSSASAVDVIPRVMGKLDRYHRIPSMLTIRSVISNKEESTTGFQMVLAGKGTLDEAGKKHIEYRFRSPDIHDKSIFGSRDEYFLSYRTDSHELHLGDRSYSLSPLTENYFYGRGIEGKLKQGKVDMGAYLVQTRWVSPEEKQMAASLYYHIDDNNRTGLNYINKKQGSQHSNIVSLRGRSITFKEARIDAEYAVNEYDDALYLNLYGKKKEATYYLKYIQAGPEFDGYYKDIRFLSASLAYAVTERLGVNTAYRSEKDNLDSDPAEGPALKEGYYSIGLDYRFVTGTTVSLDHVISKRNDRLPSPDFDYTEKTYRLGASHSFSKFSVHGSCEFGRRDDHLTHSDATINRYTISASYRPSSKYYLNGFIRYAKNEQFSDDADRHISTGIGGLIQITSNTSADFSYLNDSYKKSDSRSRNLFDLRLSHRLSNGHLIRFTGRRTVLNASGADNDTALMLEYSIPFGLPVGKKKNIGIMTGRIYDIKSGEAVRDAVIRLSGSVAVSDPDGRFIFPALKPGTYYLNIDKSSIGLEKIPVDITPIEITVKGGEETNTDIGITRSSGLSGRVFIKQNAPDDPAGDTGSDYYLIGNRGKEKGPGNDNRPSGLPGILIEMKNGTEIKRRVTDRRGLFEFEELRPGRWTLTVSDDNIPENYYIEDSSGPINLSPGETKEIEQEVLPQRRQIQIIEEGALLMEELK